MVVIAEVRRRTASGEGAAFGLDEAQSVETLIPDCIEDGQRVNAFTLSRIAEEYGQAAARALDAALTPCPICGLAFYSHDGWGICERCELVTGEAAGLLTVDDYAVSLERAGAYSPRCDY